MDIIKGDSVKLSPNARERCVQMNLRTKVVKQIVRHHDTSWRTARQATGDYLIVANSKAFPAIAVIYTPDQLPVVVTVLWRTPERYDRATYQSGES